MGNNDGGDGIELRNTNGNGTTEAVPIKKSQRSEEVRADTDQEHQYSRNCVWP